MELVRQAWGLLDRRHRRLGALLLLMMLLGAGFEALGVGLVMPFIALIAEPGAAYEMPILSGLIESVGITSDKGIVIFAGLALLGVFVVKNAFLGLMYYAKFRFVFSNQVRLARRLFAAYLHSPYAFHLDRNSAQLLRNINEEVRLTFSHIFIPLLVLAVEFFVLFVIGALLLVVEPVVAPLAILSFGLMSLGFYRAVQKKTVRYGKEQQYQAGQMIQWVQQGLGGIKEAKVMGCEDFFLDHYDESSKRYARALSFHRFVQEIPRNVVETLGLGGMILVVILLVARGKDLTHILPVLGLFAVAAMRLLPSLTRIIAALTATRHFRPSLDVISEDLRALQGLEEGDEGAPRGGGAPITFHRELLLKDIHFTYPGATAPTLEGFDISIRRGEAVGIVGASGAGKTTAVDILLGLLEPEQGQVLVDDRPIGENLRSWQDQLGYIAQPTYLMDDTIRRNIAFGQVDELIDEERVWQALEEAQLLSLVRSFPEGLDTTIGEGGVRLSGGQRQRLGIARALYRRPALLVLDEATSALDNATEGEINQAMESLAGEVTLIIIAHRLSTVRSCDRLFFLSQGRVVDVGTFEALLARNFEFQQMVRASGPDPLGFTGAAQ